MKIAFVGDIALIGKYNLLKNPNIKTKLVTLADKLSEFDYVVGNLESPLTNEEKTMVCKSMHLKTPIINVELLKFLHIDAVSLANNHMFDYGKKGLSDTIRTLEKNDIEWFGANSKYLLKEIQGETISLSGFCCLSTNGSGYVERNRTLGVNLLNYNNIINQLKIDEKNSAYSVLSIHWGDEHTNYPNFEHISLANTILKEKDVIINGHHPHIIQGIERNNNSLVAYSLGNFLFDDCTSINGKFTVKQNENNKKSFILDIEIVDGLIMKYKTHGFIDGKEKFSFIDVEEELSSISKPLKNILSIEKYNENREKQIKKVNDEKFGKKDVFWIISKLNYYSLGSYLTTKLRKRKYKKEIVDFKGMINK